MSETRIGKVISVNSPTVTIEVSQNDSYTVGIDQIKGGHSASSIAPGDRIRIFQSGIEMEALERIEPVELLPVSELTKHSLQNQIIEQQFSFFRRLHPNYDSFYQSVTVAVTELLICPGVDPRFRQHLVDTIAEASAILNPPPAVQAQVSLATSEIMNYSNRYTFRDCSRVIGQWLTDDALATGLIYFSKLLLAASLNTEQREQRMGLVRSDEFAERIARVLRRNTAVDEIDLFYLSKALKVQINLLSTSCGFELRKYNEGSPFYLSLFEVGSIYSPLMTRTHALHLFYNPGQIAHFSSMIESLSTLPDWSQQWACTSYKVRTCFVCQRMLIPEEVEIMRQTLYSSQGNQDCISQSDPSQELRLYLVCKDCPKINIDLCIQRAIGLPDPSKTRLMQHFTNEKRNRTVVQKCGICYASHYLSECRQLSCGHCYGEQCLKQMLSFNISSRDTLVNVRKCPEDHCSGLLDSETFEELVGVEAYAEYICQNPDDRNRDSCREEVIQYVIQVLEEVENCFSEDGRYTIVQCPGCRIPYLYDGTMCRHTICPNSDCNVPFCLDCCCLRQPTLEHGNHYHRPNCHFYSPPPDQTIDPEKFEKNCPECKRAGKICAPPPNLPLPRRIPPSEDR